MNFCSVLEVLLRPETAPDKSTSSFYSQSAPRLRFFVSETI